MRSHRALRSRPTWQQAPTFARMVWNRSDSKTFLFWPLLRCTPKCCDARLQAPDAAHEADFYRISKQYPLAPLENISQTSSSETPTMTPAVAGTLLTHEALYSHQPQARTRARQYSIHAQDLWFDFVVFPRSDRQHGLFLLFLQDLEQLLRAPREQVLLETLSPSPVLHVSKSLDKQQEHQPLPGVIPLSFAARSMLHETLHWFINVIRAIRGKVFQCTRLNLNAS